MTVSLAEPTTQRAPAQRTSRVLVTGGSGFIGQHLIAALERHGDLVRVLDVERPPLHLRCEFIEGSILDRETVKRALDGIDIVYHLAAISHLWTADTDDYERINYEGTRTLLAAAAEMNIRQIVHCSTEAILFPAPGNRTDVPTHETEMPGPYTRSKFLAEQAALQAAKDGLPVVIVNPTVPIGPGDHNVTAPTAMLSMLARQPPRFVLDCTLNLVDVRDVATGMVLAGERGRPGERYILGGENISMRDLVQRVGDLTGHHTTQLSIPGSLALLAGWTAEWFAAHVSHRAPVATAEGVNIALRSVPLEITKAVDELGYAPQAIDRALADALAWLNSPEPERDPVSIQWTPEVRRAKVRS